MNQIAPPVELTPGQGKIAISYPEAAKYFPPEKVAYTGNPVRKEIEIPIIDGAREFLKLDPSLPVIFILGGSQGARILNEIILEDLPNLVSKYEIIHQTGKNNFNEVKATADAVLYDSPYKNRYKPYDYLNELAMRMSAGVANVVISRAGSTIFELAAWGVPSIIIPIPEEISHDQRKNAFAYARSGAGVVIEESNLTAHILESEIARIISHKEDAEKMKLAAKAFYKPNASKIIAEEILKIALSHEIK